MSEIAKVLGTVAGLLLATVLSADERTPRAVADGSSITCGTFRRLHSNVLGEDRTLRVRLPEGYARAELRYPVLYTLDGERPVFLETVASLEYLVDTTDKVPDHIVVGIENTDRRRDMDPEAGADRFARFVTTELVPFVEAHYRTSGFRILAGQSLSALFALHLFLKQPTAFDGYILSSPGLFKESFVPQFERELASWTATAKLGTRRLFVAVGKHDAYDPDGSITARTDRCLASVTRARGGAIALRTATYEEEGHVPFPSVYDGLRWIYSSPKPSEAAAATRTRREERP